jgi:hypothetical protein
MPHKDKEKKREWERRYWRLKHPNPGQSRQFPRRHMARLPMEPLLRTLGWPGISIKQCGRLLEVDNGFLHRMIKGGVTANLADKYACHALGKHPVSIWGPAWWDTLDIDYPQD